MNDMLNIEIVTPEASVWTGKAYFLSTKTINGSIGFFPNHIPFLGLLIKSNLKIKLSYNEEKYINFQIGHGVLMLNKNKAIIAVEAIH